MKTMVILAHNTFKEIMRDRILYGIIVFALLLFGLSAALANLSYAETSRIASNFGFVAIQMSAVILSIFVGSTLVSREIDKKTILTLLTRPINRTQFIIGKTIGLMLVILACMTVLALALVVVLFFFGRMPNVAFLVALHGIVLEALVLLALTLFFGSFSSPMLSVSFVIGIFLIGHWIETLKFFIEKSNNEIFQVVATIFTAVLPDLEVFNWRGLFIYGDVVPIRPFLWGNLYSLAWAVTLISLAAAILNRRDLG